MADPIQKAIDDLEMSSPVEDGYGSSHDDVIAIGTATRDLCLSILRSHAAISEKAKAMDALEELAEHANTDCVLVSRHGKEWFVEPVYIQLERGKSSSYAGPTLAETILLTK